MDVLHLTLFLVMSHMPNTVGIRWLHLAHVLITLPVQGRSSWKVISIHQASLKGIISDSHSQYTHDMLCEGL